MNSRSQKPSIVFVGAFPPPERPIYGGIVSSCAALLASDLSDHVDFTLVDSTQISNPPPGVMVRLVLAIKRFAGFCTTILRERPDAALIFLSTGASVLEKGLMAWFARACRVPVLLFPRAGSVMQAASQSASLRLILRVLLRPATILLCQTVAWQKFACTRLGFPANRTLVVENWTAAPEFLAIGERRSFDPEIGRPIRIVFVGWVEKEKGVFDLLEACRRFGGAFDFELQIVGDGTARSAAEGLSTAYGLASRVRFRGWLPARSLRDVLEVSDIFVLPSWAEGFPNAMIEAMAARLPVVVTRVGGIPDIIEDRVSGLLVDPRSPAALSQSLSELMTQVDMRRSIADAGYRLAIDRFSTNAATAKFLEAIALALREPASTPLREPR